METKEMLFRHCIAEGTSYEAGRSLGKVFKEDKNFIMFMTSPFMDGNKLSQYKVNKAMEFYDRFCPGINDEIRGFADYVGASAEDIVYYYAYVQLSVGNCSHMAVLPSITKDGHIYHARSYEFGWDDKPILCTSLVEGKYSHIGFGCQLFGRFDGMNQMGLCVSTSAGVIMPNINQDGFVFPVVVRSLLDRCKTAGEAVELLMSMPIADYRNFIISDKEGNASLVEVAASCREVKHINGVSDDRYVCSANHYTLPQLMKHDTGRTKHSILRYDAIKSRLETAGSNVTKDLLRNILSDTMPDGVCCHHYSDGMGTLWSIIFDPMNVEAEICFGSPAVNGWRIFGLTGGQGTSDYSASLPNKPAEPGFWNTLNPRD